MPQNVPDFRFSEDAIKVRQFLYEYWCANGYPPNLRDSAAATGLPRRRLMQAYRELDLGIMITIDQETENVNILKCMPFSAYPSQAKLYIEGRFNGYLGCAMESVAASGMPPFKSKACHIETCCSCCLAPVKLVMTDSALVSAHPETALIHVSLSPWYWNATNVVQMCDRMNYVIDRSHASVTSVRPVAAVPSSRFSRQSPSSAEVPPRACGTRIVHPISSVRSRFSMALRRWVSIPACGNVSRPHKGRNKRSINRASKAAPAN